MKKLLVFTLLLLNFACQTKQPVEKLVEQYKTDEDLLKALLNGELSSTLSFTTEERELLLTFYKNRNFAPLWVTNKQMTYLGKNLVAQFKNGIQFGLSNERFGDYWSDELAIQNELNLVIGLAKTYDDLRIGVLDSTMTNWRKPTYVPAHSLDTLLDFSSKSVKDKLISWGVPDSTYQAIALHLYDFVSTNDMHEKEMELPTHKEDSTAAMEGAKQILVKKKYLESTSVNDYDLFVSALKKFQKENGCNPDGLVGSNTVHALTETPLKKSQRLAIALEKLRHGVPSYPTRHMIINIPEYSLRLYNEDTLCIETRIVVGKFENQTPELRSKVHSIVVYPYWNVPYSIASKEILPAMQANPNYAKRNNMIFLRKGEEVDVSNVNWKKIKQNGFPYQVRQDPGPKNSLGILKFDFHNKYDVYVHDTPQKGLFNTIARAYSHGCMRTENPKDLAKTILSLEEHLVIADSLDSLIQKGENTIIRLKKPLPVYVIYQTVIATGTEIKLLRDIYHRDEKYVKAYFNKPKSTEA